MVLELSKAAKKAVKKSSKKKEAWLSLIVGNTRLHWGFFQGDQLISNWHTPHLNHQATKLIAKGRFQHEAWQAISEALPKHSLPDLLPTQAIAPSQLWIASAVPKQTSKWLAVTEEASVVQNSQIPIEGLYGTLGCDRAINLLGAGKTLGWPILVIDAGTALTFTAGIQTPKGNASFYGGAILPGVRLQRQALGEHTAALTNALTLSQSIFEHTNAFEHTDASVCSNASTNFERLEKSPGNNEPVSDILERWATDTSSAIASGLVYGMLSAITDYLCDWWRRFPTGKAIITGGDGPRLHTLLIQTLLQENRLPLQHTGRLPPNPQQKTLEIISRVQADCTVDTDLMFWGMKAYRQHILENPTAASTTAKS